MPTKPGWPQLGGNIPEFAHEQLGSLREGFFDAHGVRPGPSVVIAALVHAADLADLEAALRAYGVECKRRGIEHG